MVAADALAPAATVTSRGTEEPPAIGIYVHIPFCRTLCPYCDFIRCHTDRAVPHEFVNTLCREIAAFDGPERACTIYLGGGTPSLLALDSLAQVLDALHARFTFQVEPEVTIEANPDDVTAELAASWRALGVNRVSLGVQSFDDRVLRYLGRRHDADTARRACTLAADRFENWSIDLIFGAHPIEAWESTLSECVACAPTHVSAYGLTYEPNTPFGARAGEAVDDDTSLDLYRRAKAQLAAYDRYEISNFALTGRRCAHNLIYWRNEEYAGFGPGAYSFLDGLRPRNTPDVDTYLADPRTKSESLPLSDAEIRLETVIQHLRLREGLPKPYYALRFGRDLRDDFAESLDALIARGLIVENEDAIKPTETGFELNNELGLALVD